MQRFINGLHLVVVRAKLNKNTIFDTIDFFYFSIFLFVKGFILRSLVSMKRCYPWV